VRAVKKGTVVEAWAPLLLKGLSAALRRDVGPERHAGKRGEFGAGQGRPIPERFVGTTSKPKEPRSGARTARQQQRCSGPHSGTLAQTKKLPRLTVTAFAHLTLTDEH